MNIFEVANHFRKGKKVDFVVIHPQLCANDGDNFWRIILGKKESIDKIVVAACDPAMQKKMFGWIFRETAFDEQKFIGVEIRNMTTEEAIKAIDEVLGRG